MRYDAWHGTHPPYSVLCLPRLRGLLAGSDFADIPGDVLADDGHRHPVPVWPPCLLLDQGAAVARDFLTSSFRLRIASVIRSSTSRRSSRDAPSLTSIAFRRRSLLIRFSVPLALPINSYSGFSFSKSSVGNPSFLRPSHSASSKLISFRFE